MIITLCHAHVSCPKLLTCNAIRRSIASESGKWDRKYKRVTRVQLENFWKAKLDENWKNRNTSKRENLPKFYCLSMFPYPSGKLHMGHVRVYTISDAFAQFYRMNGYHVIHPMGWDAFGLPAENAARDRKLNPAEWTKSNISYMRKQLKDLNLMFDWEREFATCDPAYYKWTQYIFLEFFKAGLAYQKDALVNWDPVDKTVLADEQVDETGHSWRSGAIVEQKYMKQWFLKTSDYSEKLLKNLPKIEEDYGIKAMQKNWIGSIDGTYFNFHITKTKSKNIPIVAFCPQSDNAMMSSFVVIQAKFIDEISHFLQKYGDSQLEYILKNAPYNTDYIIPEYYVVNPFDGSRIPVILSNKYESCYDKVPVLLVNQELDEVAQSISESIGLKIEKSDSHFLKWPEILQKAKELGIGNGKMTSSRLRDWLISRQRYWGTPIPIIHCPEHGPVAVPTHQLPVELPRIDGVSFCSGQSPLTSMTDWVNTTCPICKALAKRETDTMDTFVDSSWYFLRYLDPNNESQPCCKESADRLMPVDLYIGGKEHAVLHLYFARFFNHFLSDKGFISHSEPFKKLLAQGIVKGLTFKEKSSGKYVPPDEVDRTGDYPVNKNSNEIVEESFEKMSKSKFNGIDPQDFIDEWGISITRLYVLYAAAPFEDIHWDVKTDVIPGVMRWQLKLWTFVTRILDARLKVQEMPITNESNDGRYLLEVDRLRFNINKAIKEVTSHFKDDCTLSAAITSLMILAKHLSNVSDHVIERSTEFERGLCAVVIMSAPMVPHFASELWSGLGLMKFKLTHQNWNENVLEQPWPKPNHDTSLRLEEYKIKVNGITCHSIRLPVETTETDAEQVILKEKKVKKILKRRVPYRTNLDKKNCVFNITTIEK